MLWVEEHFRYEIRLDQIAADINLSKSYAFPHFHQETDSSITADYLTARRSQQAHLLLSLRQ
ncbi:hypothetical protein BK141_11100 [Paenibacillus sp. FSL R5-0765]|nr:hypothetical protein BK141_11100 [Paenibacillus sp. FSL R5-0765]